jgi:hypothetical protein
MRRHASQTCVEAQCAPNPESGGVLEHKACLDHRLDIETRSEVDGDDQQQGT